MSASGQGEPVRVAVTVVQATVFTSRKTGQSPFLRQLIAPFERPRYLALFEIEDGTNGAVPALRPRFVGMARSPARQSARSTCEPRHSVFPLATPPLP